jgi:large subunit ribosomal protein L28
VEDFHTETPFGSQDRTHDAGVEKALKLYSPTMAKVCHVCSKGPSFGNSRSHSMVATRRRFDPNLQRVRIDDNGTPRRVYVCTRCLKAGKVTKAA